MRKELDYLTTDRQCMIGKQAVWNPIKRATKE